MFTREENSFKFIWNSSVFAFMNGNLNIFVSSPKVLGSNAPADLLEAKALQEVSDANDSDCVGSRFSNHLSPDLRYFAFYKRISSERSHGIVAFCSGTRKSSKVVEQKSV